LKLVVIGPVYPYRGGIAHYTSLLSHALIKKGHETYIFSFRRQYPSWLYPGKSDKEPSQPLLQIDAKYILDPVYPWSWIKTSKEIINHNPDAILIHWWTTFWGPAIWSLSKLLNRNGIKVIFLIHNVAPHEPLPWDHWIAKCVLALGDAQIVQAANEQKRLNSLLPNAKSVLCPHPVYDQFSQEIRISKIEARKRIRVKQDLPAILFFGIVRPYKGLIYAIKAISLLKADDIPVQLMVAGEFWDDINEYEDQIIELDLSEQIYLFDRYIPNEEVGLFFSAADIFIAPYIDGTQSGSVKIAMGFNLPIVVTDCVSDEILIGSESVQIIPNSDSQALAEAIREFISSELPKKRDRKYNDESWQDMITVIEKLVDQEK
jgi:glycosyltransferase involved in cell wall biosynthesis